MTTSEQAVPQHKVCFGCGADKPLIEYYKHSQMADGYLGKCKDCIRADSQERRLRLQQEDPAWVEEEKERHRTKAKDYRSKYPEKAKAHDAKQRWRRTPGKRNPNGVHSHHWSYRAEHRKDEIDLSEQEHLTIHRFMVYDQERMMYRKPDGELIDSRKAAEAYYSEILSRL